MAVGILVCWSLKHACPLHMLLISCFTACKQWEAASPFSVSCAHLIQTNATYFLVSIFLIVPIQDRFSSKFFFRRWNQVQSLLSTYEVLSRQSWHLGCASFLSVCATLSREGRKSTKVFIKSKCILKCTEPLEITRCSLLFLDSSPHPR